jgi:diguanylate cyclase (GGDEF)-like protein
MPLRAKGTVNGLIVADNIFTKKPITDADIKIFSMLADQAGLAIENSRLYEMVVHKSHTDSITNLWNHGFFQEKLSEEIQIAEQFHYPLSLAMLDIDDFKKLNDMYGHQHGDVILREVAQILRDSSRDVDYVCRYGGEEFTLILKQTRKEQSIEIAERIRKKIDSHPFPSGTDDHKLKVTVSIGLATYPDDASTKKELIDNADRAMYIAKFSGKNKTCVADANT